MSRYFRLSSWLCKHARPIPVPGAHVEVLYSPDKYYEALKHGIQTAKERIVLSSLYLGTGPRETELVDALGNALSDGSRPDLHCTVLLDHLRGSRGYPNSKTMLQDLICQFGDRFTLHLYHTPNLRGLLKQFGPERFNEVMGLQHMKIYLFDSNLLLSGANLSHDYFTNRQDRYIQFHKSPKLADLFAHLVDTVALHSFKLRPDGSTETPSAITMDPLSSKKAARAFRESLGAAVRKISDPVEVAPENATDTLVFPLVQMGYYGIKQDELVTRMLLGGLQKGEQLYLASGYFNLPPEYISTILQGSGNYHVLAASPKACGFYGARGVAGHVPYMYIHFARKFLEAISKRHSGDRVKYLEYFREKWTFHGKGLWYYLQGEELPALTLIGSSNYGHRSLTRDLEAQVAIVTKDMQLRQALHEEQRRMFDYGSELSLSEAVSSPNRQLNFLQWFATQLLKPHV